MIREHNNFFENLKVATIKIGMINYETYLNIFGCLAFVAPEPSLLLVNKFICRPSHSFDNIS